MNIEWLKTALDAIGVTKKIADVQPLVSGDGNLVMVPANASAATIQAVLSSARPGQTIMFAPGATYSITQPIYSDECTGVTIEGNGATFVASGFTGNVLSLGKLVAAHYGTPYGGTGGSLAASVTKGSRSLAVTAAVAAAGTLVIPYNVGTNRYTFGSDFYYEGHFAEVESNSGSSLTLVEPFRRAFTCTSLQVCKVARGCLVRNLKVDLSAVTDSTGISLVGIDSDVTGCTVYSNAGQSDNNKQGIYILGKNCHAVQCTTWGIYQNTAASGRMGYGINIGGLNVTAVRCRGNRHKHCLTTAERQFECVGVKFIDCTATADPETLGVTVTSGSELLALWPIDVHANADVVQIIRPIVTGPRYGFGIRNGAAHIEGGQSYCTDPAGTNGILVYRFEVSDFDIAVVGHNAYNWLVLQLYDTFGNFGTCRGVRWERNYFSRCQSLRIRSSGTQSWRGVKIRDNVFELVQGGIVVDLNGFSGIVEDLEVTGNDFDMASGGQALLAASSTSGTLRNLTFSRNRYAAGSQSSARAVSITSGVSMQGAVFEANNTAGTGAYHYEITASGAGLRFRHNEVLSTSKPATADARVTTATYVQADNAWQSGGVVAV